MAVHARDVQGCEATLVKRTAEISVNYLQMYKKEGGLGIQVLMWGGGGGGGGGVLIPIYNLYRDVPPNRVLGFDLYS